MRVTRFVIISSNELIRYGLASILENSLSPDMQISTYSSMDTYVKSHSDVQTLIFLDDDLPSHQSHFNLIRLTKAKGLCRRLVLLGSFLSVSYIQKTLDAGADGFIYKQDALEEVVHLAIQTVLGGHIFLSPKASALPYEGKHPALNQNDIEVLSLLAEGFSVQDIASRLNIVDRSIYRIRTRIREYLGVTNNEQIVDAARRRHLLE